MVMLSHPSPIAIVGAKHRSSTLSQTAESFVSCAQKWCNVNIIIKTPEQ